MTKKEIDKIAEAVVSLLMKKQKVIDEEFKKDVEKMLDSQEDVSFGMITQEDLLQIDVQHALFFCYQGLVARK